MIYNGTENSKKAKVKLRTSRMNRKIPPIVCMTIPARSVLAFKAIVNRPDTTSAIKVVIVATHLRFSILTMLYSPQDSNAEMATVTGIGASKIAGRPGLALGGRGLVPGPAFVVRGTSRSDGRVRANQEVSLRIIIKLDVLSHIR